MLDEWRAEVAKVAQRARRRGVIDLGPDDVASWERGVADGLDMAIWSLGDLVHGDDEATPDA